VARIGKNRKIRGDFFGKLEEKRAL